MTARVLRTAFLTFALVITQAPTLLPFVAERAPASAYAAAAGRVYVSNQGAGTVTVIDPATNTVVATITVGGTPYGVTASADGTRVWVANYGSQQIHVIDTATNTVVTTASIVGNPHSIALSPSGHRAYVTVFSSTNPASANTVWVFDATISPPYPMATIPVGTGPAGITMRPDGSRLYVANYGGGGGTTMSVIDPSTNGVIATVTVGSAPFQIGAHPDNSRVYVANRNSNTVSVVDTATNTVTATIGAGTTPVFAALDATGARVYVTNIEGGSVTVIGTSTNTVIDTIASVNTLPRGIGVSADGRYLYVAGTSGLRAVDLVTSTITTLTTGGDPFFVAVVPSAGNTLSGIARCEQSEGSILLTGGTVELFTGSVRVATTTAAASTAAYSFAGVAPNAAYTLRYTKTFVTEIGTYTITCSTTVTTDGNGSAAGGDGVYIPNNHNHTWNTALALTPGAPVQDYVFQSGQSTWFKVPVRPGQRVTVRLSGVPADYSLALYKDIRKLYDAQVAALGGSDPLGAVNDFDASVAPDALSPDALSPDALSPDALSPDALSPDALSPDALSPDALSPDALSPDELSPDALSPDALSPDALSPDALSPDELSAEAYAAAQTAALIGVSAHIGLSPEQITRNTWDNDGHFYMRVRGHNGAFDASRPFTIEATVVDVSCGGATLASAPVAFSAPATSRTSLILTNYTRLTGDTAGLGSKLGQLAGHAAVRGAVVDLGAIPAVASAYSQWDLNQSCPAAANIVAHAVKDVVNAYRTANPGLRYVVLAGNDHVIPFLRQPDQSGLGNEKDYFPAVLESTASQASLRLGHVLTQDFYGSTRAISRFDHVLYLPDLGVGRLVETTDQMTAVIDAFLATDGAVSPTSALVAGYDFLSDAAAAIADDLSANALTVDRSLIQPIGDGPNKPTAWTAAQLGAKLFGATAYGIVNVNAHFSANALLAADFATRLQPSSVTALPASDTRFRNALILSTGCHSGYNLVDPHATPLTTPLDWTQAFAARGATMVGGTGYQYGDTDFIKYSEKLYAGLVRQLRYGSGPVRIGAALTSAKLDYISSLAQLGGIDEKSLVQMSLYGLPMMGFDLPAGSRLAAPTTSTVTGLTDLASDGLSVATITPQYALDRNTRTLDVLGGGTEQAVYYDIADNVSVQPGTPVLPQLTLGVGVTRRAVRGAVLHTAAYADETGITPFTDVAVTEARGAHPSYQTDVFTPVRPFDLNHFSGSNLVSTPFQYRSDSGGPTGTGRRFTAQTYRLYYSTLTDTRALAAAPVVYRVTLAPNGASVDVEAVLGALAAVGIEEVFATYTAESGSLYGQGSSLALTPVSTTTNGAGLARTYRGSIPLGTSTAAGIRVILQAVGGNGLVTWASDQGAYYRVRTETATAEDPKLATALTLTAPVSGAYRSHISVSARLTSGSTGVAGKPVAFRVGGARADATTDANGYASAQLTLDAAPGTTTVRVGFAEDATHLGAGAQSAITVTRAAASFALFDTTLTPLGGSTLLATLRGGGEPLGLQLITLTGGGRTVQTYTDGYGRVRLDTADFPGGAYSVAIDYAGNDRYQATSTTALVVIYDTSTSATGGGWILIPADAVGLASGRKLTFGTSMKFKDGTTVPTGNLEIMAKDAGLTLRATSYEWLAIGSGTATAQGHATVNGSTSGWSFRVTLVDGAPERFELRVWQDGVTTYDAPTYRAGNTLGGGNVTVR